MKNKNKKNKLTTTGRKSLKGIHGQVGAPAKITKWPTAPFSTAQLFKRNSKGVNAQCELSLRTKLEARIEDGSVIALVTKKQKGGGVGRPKSMFILATKFNAKKHTKAGATPTPKVRKTRTTVAVSTVATPATAPVVIVTSAPQPVAATIEPPVSPEVTAPVETVATVEAPAPQPEAPAAVSTEPVTA